MRLSLDGVIRGTLVVCAVLVVLATAFRADWLLRVAAAIEVVGLVLALPRLRRLTLFYVVILLAGSAALLALFPSGWDGIGAGLQDAAVFAGFMAAVVMMRNTVSRHPAIERIRQDFQVLPVTDRNGGMFVAGHMLGSVMTFGCLALLAPLFAADNNVESRRANALIILRSISLSVFWSPFTVAIALVLTRLPELPPWVVFPVGFVIVLAGTLLSILRGEIRVTLGTVTAVLKVIRPIVAPLAIPILAIFVLPSLLGLSSLATVAVVLPLFCLGWLATIDPGLVAPTLRATAGQLDMMIDEVTFFTCSILLADIIAHGDGLVMLIGQMFPIHDPGFPHMAAAAGLIALGSALGIHMVVPGSIVLAILGPQIHGVVPQLGFAMLVLLAWCFGSMATMSSVAMLATSTAFNVPIGRLIRSPNLSLIFLLSLFVLAGTAAAMSFR